MQLRATRLLAVVSLLAMIPLFSLSQASANSALDQYVEEVPNIGNTGNDGSNGNGSGTKPLKPEVAKKLDSSGDDGSALGQVAAATAPVVAMTGSPAGSGKSGKPGGKASHPTKQRDASGKDELSKLLVADTPGAGKSLAAAADASGVNGPLAIFVAVVALAMGAFAYRRHLRSRSR